MFARAITTALGLTFAVAAHADPVPRFTSTAVWNQNIETATLHPDSASMISALAGLGGFGNGRLLLEFLPFFVSREVLREGKSRHSFGRFERLQREQQTVAAGPRGSLEDMMSRLQTGREP